MGKGPASSGPPNVAAPAKPTVDPDKIAYRGEVELLNAAWSLDAGRTVELRLAGDAYTRLHPFKRFQQRRNGRMGSRFHCAVGDAKTGQLHFRGETMLAGWKDSSFSGQTITLWLDEEADRHPFAGFNRRKNGTPGDMFYLALVEIDENEQPVKQQQRERAIDGSAEVREPGARAAGPSGKSVAKGAPGGARRSKPSQTAHLIVTSNMFVRWLVETRPKLVKQWTPEVARRWVKSEINVESLSQLDREPAALERFETQIRKPYARWNNQEA